MKNKTFLIISLTMNILFTSLLLIYLFTPYLDSIVADKFFLGTSKVKELTLEMEKSCDNAKYLRWNGLNEANIRPLLISASIEENMNYYMENINLIPTGIDAQGGEVSESDRESLLEEYKTVLKNAQPIYDEYLEEKAKCESLTEKLLLEYGEE